MFDDGSKLDVQMSREPVTGLQVSQQLLGGWTSQRVALHFLSEELFLLQQLIGSPVVVDSTRPVVTHEDVDGPLDLNMGRRPKADSKVEEHGGASGIFSLLPV